ncbi:MULTISPECIES: sensor histidine kinase [Actinomycetes]|uniref:histidine kinase n=2 Tax=Actinomycetes TaxID=1760 RepID=A0ABP6LX39_9MICC|nr:MULTISPECIES: HAMP domain-containing sensor histidine kinase [unclassified Nesterenkonia]MDS2172334.1 HAMP domain-containing sensor histidine kinase [Nesterenkonia sp. CL21]OSM42536.1 two-component sensor histidine kinase [Nesterenkonia sp. PF2B19]
MAFTPVRSAARRWRSASLRTQLVFIISGLLLLTLAVTTFVSASLFRQELLRSLDEDLYTNRNNISMYLTEMGSDPEDRANALAILRFYGVLLTNDGQPMEYSATHRRVEGQDLPEIPPLTAEDVLAQAGQSFEVPGTEEGSRGWRVQVYRLESGEASLAIALPLEDVDTSVERATFLVATIGLLATLGASTIAYAVVTRAFRPLFRVEKTAAAIAGGDFSQRVETTAPPETEIGRLSSSLNVMLEHIEEAFQAKTASEQKMRQFIQDASHELRTPLVTIRGFSELYRQGGVSDNPEAVGAAMSRIESEAKRMGQLVEDMLTLARLDEQRPLQLAPVDLNLIAHDTAMDMGVNAPDRTVQVVGLHGGSPAAAPVLGDEGKIRQIVTNLVTNALRYTPEGSPIELVVGTESLVAGRTDSVLQVRDHGEGISEEDAARIFERFYRADNSRDRGTGGTGLGLAIVAAIAAQHGGTVRHQQTPGGGATMTLRLPMVEPSDQSDHESDVEDHELAELQDGPVPPQGRSDGDDTPGSSTGR